MPKASKKSWKRKIKKVRTKKGKELIYADTEEPVTSSNIKKLIDGQCGVEGAI